MNADIHAEISAKNRGGKPEDYWKLHDFLDCSKEVEPTNRHRIFFHCMPFVKEIVIPIFGSSIINSDGNKVNVKDICEQDHILPDYAGKFIPTWGDFIDNVSDDENDEKLIEEFRKENHHIFNKDTNRIMLLPMMITGKIKSLLITHNSWFITYILPQVFPKLIVEIKNYNITPSTLFSRMSWANWMDNGKGLPPSYQKIKDKDDEKKKNLKKFIKFDEDDLGKTYDGSKFVIDGGKIKPEDGIRFPSDPINPYPPIDPNKINPAPPFPKGPDFFGPRVFD